MNLEQLKSFRSVAEKGGFRRAAEARFLSQSAISTQIAALEREMGVRLFDRLGWSVVLTDAGEEFLRYATRILTLIEDAGQAMESIRGLTAGRITVGASHTVGNYLVPDIFGQFNAQYPGVRLVLEIGSTPRTAEKVLDGSLDIGLVEAPISSPDLAIQRFATDELVLIVPPEHRWAPQGAIDPLDLAGERFIAREPESLSRRIVEEHLRARGVELSPVLELGTPEAIRGAVRAGLGVAILSRRTISLALEAGAVAEVALRGLRLERDLYVILHRDKHVSAGISAFLRLLGLDPAALGERIDLKPML